MQLVSAYCVHALRQVDDYVESFQCVFVADIVLKCKFCIVARTVDARSFAPTAMFLTKKQI
jgi:hypothetical protein